MIDARFTRVRLARLWLWPLGGAIVVVLAYLMGRGGTEPPFVPVAYVTYGFLMLAALRSCRQAGIQPAELFTRVPRDPGLWGTVVILVPVIFTFAAMSLWATAYAASWVAPDLAEYLFREQRDPGPLKSLGQSGSAFLVLFVVAVGPVIEEFVFRGLVLRRWISKSSLWRGVIGTSAVFALLHPPFWIGAMVVGVFLSMLYLVTRSLYVPIVFHALYNGLVTLATIGAEKFATDDKPTTLPEFRGQWAGELALLLISGWIVLRTIRGFAARLRERDRAADASLPGPPPIAG